MDGYIVDAMPHDIEESVQIFPKYNLDYKCVDMAGVEIIIPDGAGPKWVDGRHKLADEMVTDAEQLTEAWESADWKGDHDMPLKDIEVALGNCYPPPPPIAQVVKI